MMNNANNNANTFNNLLSVYIPRITPEWAQEAMIAEVFRRNELGLVERVDLIYKQSDDGNFYYQAFVHMEWTDTQCVRNIQERIMDPSRQARLVHDDPSYWLLLENKNPMTATEVRIEKCIVELDTRSAKQAQVALSQFNRILELETQTMMLRTMMLAQQTKMNYWSDPALYGWTAPPGTSSTNTGTSTSTSNGIAPLWCHPVNEPTQTPTPSWCDDDCGVETAKTMNTYAEDAERFQATECYDGPDDYNDGDNVCDNVCDYYDYDPYDMDILE